MGLTDDELRDVLARVDEIQRWKGIAKAADEAGTRDDADFPVPEWTNRWGIRFYSLKAGALLLAYAALILAVLQLLDP